MTDPIIFDERLTSEDGWSELEVQGTSETVTIHRPGHASFDLARRRDEIQIDRKHARWLRDALTRMLEAEGGE